VVEHRKEGKHTLVFESRNKPTTSGKLYVATHTAG